MPPGSDALALPQRCRCLGGLAEEEAVLAPVLADRGPVTMEDGEQGGARHVRALYLTDY